MKKVEPPADDIRAEYRKQDLGALVRGKYAARVAKASNVVVIDDALTQAFPNSEAVNEALRSLLAVAKAAVQVPAPAKKSIRAKASARVEP